MPAEMTKIAVEVKNAELAAWLEEMVTAGFRVCIFSARSNKPEGIEAMKRWFQKHELPDWLFACLAFPTTKPGALLYIDDRGFHFEGEFPTVDYIRKFKPWNKR